jgi:ribosomal protein L37E
MIGFIVGAILGNFVHNANEAAKSVRQAADRYATDAIPTAPAPAAGAPAPAPAPAPAAGAPAAGAPAAGAPAVALSKFCARCGATFEETSKYCEKCGAIRQKFTPRS